MKKTAKKPIDFVYWYRKCLRVHDNQGLQIAASKETTKNMLNIFIIDPYFWQKGDIHENRLNFLLESLRDLDENLRTRGSQLTLIQGNPTEVMSKLAPKTSEVAFEIDTEPYARERDSKIEDILKETGTTLHKCSGHTLLDIGDLEQIGKLASNMTAFVNTLSKFKIPKPFDTPDKLSGLPESYEKLMNELGLKIFPKVPANLDELLNRTYKVTTTFKGGETQGLSVMKNYLKDKKKVLTFQKPYTDPTALTPSTTALSPYLKFGCVSVRVFYQELQTLIKESGGKCTAPPESLLGQLYWREFFYSKSYTVKNFHLMESNTICRQIPWSKDEETLKKWEMGQTGYPAVDAVMNQLRTEGWMHHLGRHLVACFLTRGDLWISWERGVSVFDKYLLDADYALNNANWMWLSSSAFFHQYWKVYSPVSFFQGKDKNGDYIRKWVPLLKKYPKEYIYEPWKAPIQLQKGCGCIIGTDYPRPIVDHKEVSQRNIARLKVIYAGGTLNLNEEEKKSSDLPKFLDDNQDDPRPLKKTQIDQIPDLTNKEASSKRVRGKSVTQSGQKTLLEMIQPQTNKKK